MTTLEGVDYSDSRPSPTGLANVGKAFAGRYVGAGFGMKMLTTDEAKALSAAGLKIVSLVEGAELDPLQGFNKGREHGMAAIEYHRTHGLPMPPCWYFALDFDVQADQWPAVVEYLRGAASAVGLGRVGIYGGIAAMRWAFRDGVAAWFFQTYAWSGGLWFNHNNLEQYRNDVSLVGGTVDLDRAITVPYGGWSMTTEPTAPVDESTQIEQTHWSVGRGAPKQPGAEPAGNEAITYWCGHTTDRLVSLQAAVDALGAAKPAEGAPVDLAPVLAALQDVQAALVALRESPAIDAVAVAQAFATSPDVVEHLAAAVAGKLASIVGEVTMSGSLTAGIRPQAT